MVNCLALWKAASSGVDLSSAETCLGSRFHTSTGSTHAVWGSGDQSSGFAGENVRCAHLSAWRSRQGSHEATSGLSLIARSVRPLEVLPYPHTVRARTSLPRLRSPAWRAGASCGPGGRAAGPHPCWSALPCPGGSHEPWPPFPDLGKRELFLPRVTTFCLL